MLFAGRGGRPSSLRIVTKSWTVDDLSPVGTVTENGTESGHYHAIQQASDLVRETRTIEFLSSFPHCPFDHDPLPSRCAQISFHLSIVLLELIKHYIVR